LTWNPVKNAINDIKLLYEIISDKNTDLGAKFRSRSRSMPSMFEDIGFIPVLSFCFGKIGLEKYKRIARVLSELEDFSDFNKAWSEIKDIKTEDASYGLYLYFSLKQLRDMGLVKSPIENPLKILEELMGKEAIAYRLLRPYLIQIKKLSEALFAEEL